MLVTYWAPVDNSSPVATQVGHKTKPKATNLYSACIYKMIPIKSIKKGKEMVSGKAEGKDVTKARITVEADLGKVGTQL